MSFHINFCVNVISAGALLMMNTSLNENALECSKLENSLLLNCSLTVECGQLATVTCKPGIHTMSCVMYNINKLYLCVYCGSRIKNF